MHALGATAAARADRQTISFNRFNLQSIRGLLSEVHQREVHYRPKVHYLEHCSMNELPMEAFHTMEVRSRDAHEPDGRILFGE